MADETKQPAAIVIAQAPTPPPEELYAIVLAGNHDPRQHSPFWYHLIEALGEQDAREAQASLVVTPDFSMFNAPDYGIASGQNHWQITTTEEKNWTRIINIATKVFDEKLFQLSITAIGANCILHPETKHKRTGPVIAKVIGGTGLFPDFGSVSNANATLVSQADNRKTTITAGESVLGVNRLGITHSVHRTLDHRTGYYTIGGELQHCESDWRHGKQFAAELVRRINDLPEVENAH